ncbi:MAG TPA: DUF6146 family protein [Flavobacterium sp.]|nr:DUF6146 family protein [Flavobacterium sp.]HQW69243.1 DUF6146 family protein [Flavobacterium sp.]
MKNIFFSLFIIILVISCQSTKNQVVQNNNLKPSDTVKIANEELEYEVIIIDPGFSSWILGRAQPRGFHSETFLENRNRIYVAEWNRRAMQPLSFNPNLYEMQIDYNPNIHYGYEVNYLIYNYFIYFQITYKQQLAGFVPRI